MGSWRSGDIRACGPLSSLANKKPFADLGAGHLQQPHLQRLEHLGCAVTPPSSAGAERLIHPQMRKFSEEAMRPGSKPQ